MRMDGRGHDLFSQDLTFYYLHNDQLVSLGVHWNALIILVLFIEPQLRVLTTSVVRARPCDSCCLVSLNELIPSAIATAVN